MKKLISMLILALVVGSGLFASQYVYYEGTCGQVISGKQSNVKYQLRYDDETEDLIFVREVGKSLTTFFITKANIDNLRKAIEKYNEWESIAIQNEKTLQKDIPDVGFTTSELLSVYGVNRQHSVDIYFTFFSQNVENHQIVIRGNKKSGAMEDYYFSKGQANKLFEAISEAKLQEFKEALKAQKENEDSMFN